MGSGRTRARYWEQSLPYTTYVWGAPTKGTYRFIGGQETSDEVNAWPLMEGKWDEGGNFFSIKRDCSVDGTILRLGVNVDPKKSPTFYEGPVFPAYQTETRSLASTVGLLAASEIDLDALGTTAISRVEPTRSHADVAVALGELYRDGIPAAIGASLLKRKGLNRQNIGGEYLNVEFGWKPFVSDLKKLAAAAKEAESIMAQYQRDSGKWVRRRYSFPTERQTTVTTQAGVPVKHAGITLNMWNEYKGTLQVTRSIERKTWFSGAFSYHTDVGDRAKSKLVEYAQMADKLYGLELTPETVWNLAPWSWAVDWVTNVGDLIHNVSAFVQDGLIMQYGYIMRETTQETNHYMYGLNSRPDNKPKSTTQRDVYTVKQRRRATPFGFGLEVGDFTPRQWAIIAALGMSRRGRYTAM
nr:MAG: hypothetical protein 1 [Leviviridae sp.]